MRGVADEASLHHPRSPPAVRPRGLGDPCYRICHILGVSVSFPVQSLNLFLSPIVFVNGSVPQNLD